MSKTLEQHNYHGIDATIIADSKNKYGQRITSFVCTFPRIVLAEFNTHRMLSRNSASSRAVPFKKMLKDIEEHPFIPIKWMKDHKGMQGDSFYKDSMAIAVNEGCWLGARDHAVKYAKLLNQDGNGVTKQFVNRLLEPFKWHTVIVTATEWENFFALRADEAAEIHIQDLAFKMLEEYNNSTPKQLSSGEWHIPFGDNIDEERLWKLINSWEESRGNDPADSYYGTNVEGFEEVKRQIAVARCARVSYENFDGSDDYEKDIKLYDRLASMGHWSPFEHCARSMNEKEFHQHIRTDKANTISTEGPESHECGIVESTVCYLNKKDLGWSGNFQGFVQLRKTFEDENKTDERVKTNS